MSSANSMTVVGRVGADPIVRETTSGIEYVCFSVATSTKMKDGGERTEWHDVKSFNETVVRVVREYVFKGSLVYVVGPIQTNVSSKDSAVKFRTIIVHSPAYLRLLSTKSEREKESCKPVSEDDKERVKISEDEMLDNCF